MKRAAALACAIVLAAAWAVASAVSASPSPAGLRAFVCQRALNPAHRLISITAVMKPRLGTARMELKFELLERAKQATAATKVSGGDLGDWLAPRDSTLGSRPGDVWILKHPVKDLAGPAHYRFRVTFRWSGKHRRALGTSVRVSRPCYQPELRADLLVRKIQVQSVSGQPASSQYVATIGNAGATDAGPFEVVFSDGAVVIKRPVTGLRSHATITETFLGPACVAASPPTISVDPAHQADDANPANNTLAANCSGTAGS